MISTRDVQVCLSVLHVGQVICTTSRHIGQESLRRPRRLGQYFSLCPWCGDSRWLERLRIELVMRCIENPDRIRIQTYKVQEGIERFNRGRATQGMEAGKNQRKEATREDIQRSRKVSDSH